MPDIRSEVQAAIEDIDSGRSDVARQSLTALLNALDKKKGRRVADCCPHPEIGEEATDA
jgi:hypothetical protein